jgi:phosphocarrier protein FPr
LNGVAASSGIAIGPLARLGAAAVAIDDEPSGPPAEERVRLEQALVAARDDLDHTRASVAERAGAAEAEIFNAHAALLGDDALLGPARRAIDAGASAAAAWRDAAAEVAAVYAGLDDPYLRERAADVQDVGRRVVAHLAGAAPGPSVVASGDPAIVVAAELTPGEAAALDPAQVAGIATAHGGATGHAAILARALGIPAVVGLGEGLLALDAGTTLVVDGDAGTVVVDPGEEAVRRGAVRREAFAARRRVALARAGEAGALRDGTRVEVFANLGGAAEVAAAVEQGAEGVGLLRTEFLFLDRATPPDEDEQVAVLTEVARALEGRPLVVRTLDAGADKPLPFLPQEAEANPFLGRRGIRLSLAEPALLRTQLRAIVRVAAEHPLKVMFPMVATLEEIRAARVLLDEARAELDGRAELEVGVMVEVPALALAADRAAREVDFFSVGTNDLTQYTMAAERGNAALAPLLDGPLPAVLALIDRVCRAADTHGRWVGVCGELAGEPGAAVLLAGLGVRELSMAASRIPEVKAALREVDAGAARAAAAAALDCEDAAAVRALAAGLRDSA